jgi:hypothetical protein
MQAKTISSRSGGGTINSIENTLEVRSKRGLFWALCLSSVLWIAYLLHDTFWSAVLNGQLVLSVTYIGEFLFQAFYVLLISIIVLHIATEQVSINPNRLLVKSLLFRWSLPWSSVESILVPPVYGYTFFFGYNLYVFAPKLSRFQRFAPLSTSLYSNQHELAKAALEAAYLANKNVAIKGSITSDYGSPPFGIFQKTR